jgi:hypothetical protein
LHQNQLTDGFQKPDQETLESSFCDRGILVVPGAALHAANLALQPPLSNTSDMGTSVPCDCDPVSSLVHTYAAAPLARRRFPLERHRLLRNLEIHLLLSGPVALVHIWLLQIITTLLLTWSRSYQPRVPLTALLVGLGATNVMVYWGIVAVSRESFRKQKLSTASIPAPAIERQQDRRPRCMQPEQSC